MALLYTDSISYDENFAGDRYQFVNGGPTWTTSTNYIWTSGGRFNDRWAQQYTGYWANGNWGGGCNWRISFGGTADTIIVQMGYYPKTYASGGLYPLSFFSVADNETHCYLEDVGGTLRACRGDTTVLGTSTESLDQSWHHLICKVYIHDTAGTFYVTVDGDVHLNLTSQDTKYAATALCNAVDIGRVKQNYGLMGFQDVVIMDDSGSYCNDILGDRRVKGVPPTSDGYYSDFTPSTGSDHYSLVDGVPPSDSDYNSSSSVGDKDTFDKADLSGVGTIDGMMITMRAELEDAGYSKVQGIVRSNSIDGVGGEISVHSPFGYLQSVIYEDPNTSAQFTGTNFNAAEFGYKRSS